MFSWKLGKWNTMRNRKLIPDIKARSTHKVKQSGHVKNVHNLSQKY